MSTQGALTPSPSSSSTPEWIYDIFLSFRGKDTRKNFTGHLYNALEMKGIWTFRDDKKLKRGNTISEELLKAIEKSKIAIVIFSENYASSKWCLDELVHIVRCMEETKLKVVPVFYNVDPTDVRKQRGPFAKAFKKHKKGFGRNILQEWRSALRRVANLSGWDIRDRHEANSIEKIVREMMKNLNSKISSTTKNLLGRESSVQKLISSYFGFKNNVGMIGIYGIGGLGKTTLARHVYDNFHSHFEGSSFIANIRERSKNHCMHKLQQELLRDILEDDKIVINDDHTGDGMIERRLRFKKVLLVIDDVDHVDQLKSLAGDLKWFGKGSCIIITTRDERVLIQHGVVERHKPNELDSDDALKLFCLEAFKNEQPKKDYMELCWKIVEYANGLPLAIVTLGSFFLERTIDEWQCAWDGFKKTDSTIFDVLRISYDGLTAQQFKDIFLHIACFFRLKEKDKVIQILTNCGFDASYGISVLIDKSLLTVNDKNCLRMHDLLQEMGEQIVRQESGRNLGKQSRLWLREHLLYVLENNMATTAIQAIVIRCKKNDLKLFEVLSKNTMSNLKLVIFEIVTGDVGGHFYQRELFVPNQLRHLSWIRCPSKCLSSSSQLKELVQLDLELSKIKYLWEGVMNSVNLKFINVSYSTLIRTPDFSGVPILERLDLSFCRSLVEIDPSIGKLRSLKYLVMRDCSSLSNLPKMYAEMMQSLKVLDLSYCSKLSSIPEFSGIMKSLLKLNLRSTAIEEVKPSSIKCLTALTFLDLSHCTSLECLPSNMDTLKSLETLKFSKCSKRKSMPRFPSNVRYIEAGDFSPLGWSPEWVKLSIWSQDLSQWLPIDESGSLEGPALLLPVLQSNPVALTIMFHVLLGLIFHKAVLGGYIIWSCSTYLIRPSINIELPSNWYNSEWIGFALWAPLQRCGEEVRAHVIAPGDMLWNHRAPVHCTTYIDRICLWYLSREDWIATVGDGECSQIKVKLSNSIGSAVHIGGACGVSLIYKQDEVHVDELNETNAPYFIESTVEKVFICKLTAGDEDVRTVDDEGAHKFGYDDFDDTDIW